MIACPELYQSISTSWLRDLPPNDPTQESFCLYFYAFQIRHEHLTLLMNYSSPLVYLARVLGLQVPTTFFWSWGWTNHWMDEKPSKNNRTYFEPTHFRADHNDIIYWLGIFALVSWIWVMSYMTRQYWCGWNYSNDKKISVARSQENLLKRTKSFKLDKMKSFREISKQKQKISVVRNISKGSKPFESKDTPI